MTVPYFMGVISAKQIESIYPCSGGGGLGGWGVAWKGRQ